MTYKDVKAKEAEKWILLMASLQYTVAEGSCKVMLIDSKTQKILVWVKKSGCENPADKILMLKKQYESYVCQKQKQK